MQNRPPEREDPRLGHGPNIKTYDSSNVRIWEAWRSLEKDLTIVGGRAAFMILGQSQKADETYFDMFALWDSILVRLFRHYTNSAINEIRNAYDATAERTGLEEDFAFWRRERDKRVAHPIGHHEFHQVRVYLDDVGVLDRVEFGGGELFATANEARKVLTFSTDMSETEAKPRLRALQKEIEAEVRQLSPKALARLRPYFMHAHGRRFGA